ncbi:MAG: metalloregulator ArsR/SmtB family transcription factor [Methanospirillum sp.]
MPIPREVEESLTAIGGVPGLETLLPDDRDLTEASRVHHALSEPLRLRIAYALAVQPLCVCVIKEIAGIADSKLSYHLNQLKKADLIVGEQQGSWIIYRLTPRGERCMAQPYPPSD